MKKEERKERSKGGREGEKEGSWPWSLDLVFFLDLSWHPLIGPRYFCFQGWGATKPWGSLGPWQWASLRPSVRETMADG